MATIEEVAKALTERTAEVIQSQFEGEFAKNTFIIGKLDNLDLASALTIAGLWLAANVDRIKMGHVNHNIMIRPEGDKYVDLAFSAYAAGQRFLEG